MLVSFEGQDGAGKTAVLTAVHHELTRRDIASVVVEEFSVSRYGQPLVEAVARDKFLRPHPGEPATHYTRALEEVTDLYYLDERVIRPAIERDQVVLKDRHCDSVLYTLAPMLCDAGALQDEAAALDWLRGLLSRLTYWPNLTVYVDAPLDVRVDRLRRRVRPLVEACGNQVSAADLSVFARREALARRLIAAERGRFFVLDNGRRALPEGVAEVVEMVQGRLDWTVFEGASRHDNRG